MRSRLLARGLHLLNRIRWYVTRPITVGVRVLLVRDGEVLLVKHTYSRHMYLPGGGVKRGETIEEAIRREAAEEVGAELGELRALGVYTNLFEHRSDHVVVFVCDDFSITPVTCAEIEYCEFRRFDDLPSETSLGTRRRIEEYASGATGNSIVGVW